MSPFFCLKKVIKMKLNVVTLGKMNYQEAFDLQFKLLEKRKNEEIDDTFLLVEHPPVITLGRNAKKENILFSEKYLKEHDVDLVEINRGGDVTYHGPGQLVGYPIVNIKKQKLGIKDFVYKLEQIFIDLLKEEYNIEADRDDINNGVWVNNEKITAVGLAVKRWVTMHGFALNVSTDLDFFKLIVPCGIEGREVTSLEKLTGKEIDMEKIGEKVQEYFVREFNYTDVIKTSIEELEV